MKYKLTIRTAEDAAKVTRTFVEAEGFIALNGFIIFQNNASSVPVQVAAFQARDIITITSTPEKTTT